MFVVIVVLLLVGYNSLYVGSNNLLNGGQGPGFWEAIGWKDAPGVEKKLQPTTTSDASGSPSFTLV